jgi:hypothetical protein
VQAHVRRVAGSVGEVEERDLERQPHGTRVLERLAEVAATSSEMAASWAGEQRTARACPSTLRIVLAISSSSPVRWSVGTLRMASAILTAGAKLRLPSQRISAGI